MLTIATGKEVALLLIHTPTKYGSDLFRQIFKKLTDLSISQPLGALVGLPPRRDSSRSTAYLQKTVKKMMGCRNPQCGDARYVCSKSHEERIDPFSCKTRFYSSCGKVRADEWVRHISQELSDVRHLHLVLTNAEEMRPYVNRHRNLLKLLRTVAPDAVRQVIARTYGDIRVWLVYTCHTLGRDLVFKPHVHLVMTKEGMKEGAWVDIAGVPGGK